MTSVTRTACLLLGGVLAAVSVLPARGQDARPAAVVELFTSQGCSSCPPADALLKALAARPGIVALSMPIDYWDHLGWKDTLAKPMFSARQQAYARSRGDNQVFTPQMVINGLQQVIGSDAEAVETAMNATGKAFGVLSIPIAIEDRNGQIHVELPDSTSALPHGEVWLLALTTKRVVQVERGENRDRRMVYVNVVRKMVRLGDWRGKECRFMIDAATALPEEADRAVVLLQAGNGGAPGAVLGTSAMIAMSRPQEPAVQP